MDAFEWLSLIGFLVVWWTNPFDSGSSSYHMRRKYRVMKTRFPKPPGWIFLPVWSVLYTLIAVSLWLYLNYSPTENRGSKGRIYDALFGLSIANYVLNKIWTLIFFTMERYWIGTIDAALVTLSAAAMEFLLWYRNGLGASVFVASVLFIPYCLWSIYATFLSVDIAVHNSGVSSLIAQTKERVVSSSSSAKMAETDVHMQELDLRMTKQQRRRRGGGQQRRNRQPVVGRGTPLHASELW